MFNFLRVGLTAVLLAAGAAGLVRAYPGQPQTVWPINEAPAVLKPTIDQADALISSQQSVLLRQLTKALSEGGLAGALQSCHLEATSNANWVGRSHGYPMGRTGDRLRDPTNKPRPWAARIVEANKGRQASEVQGFAVDLGDRLGVMRPIAMQPICDACHGDPDRIQPAVKAALQDRYPVDHAVGFKQGEVRGWYWIEIPKAAAK